MANIKNFFKKANKVEGTVVETAEVKTEDVKMEEKEVKEKKFNGKKILGGVVAIGAAVAAIGYALTRGKDSSDGYTDIDGTEVEADSFDTAESSSSDAE